MTSWERTTFPILPRQPMGLALKLCILMTKLIKSSRLLPTAAYTGGLCLFVYELCTGKNTRFLINLTSGLCMCNVQMYVFQCLYIWMDTQTCVLAWRRKNKSNQVDRVIWAWMFCYLTSNAAGLAMITGTKRKSAGKLLCFSSMIRVKRGSANCSFNQALGLTITSTPAISHSDN